MKADVVVYTYYINSTSYKERKKLAVSKLYQGCALWLLITGKVSAGIEEAANNSVSPLE